MKFHKNTQFEQRVKINTFVKTKRKNLNVLYQLLK
jgi:hypothetical protein